MNRQQKRTLVRIFVSAPLLITAVLLPLEGVSRLLVFLIPYGVIGWDVLWRAVRNIAHGQVFDENFLMALATVGALGVGEYPEAVFVMLFYQVGELFQSCAVGKSRQSIATLMDIRPDCATIEADGALKTVDPEAVVPGDVIVVKPGERVPLDGVVLEGASSLDTAALTGESLPRPISAGDEIVSGCVNLSGLLRIRVTRPFSESAVARILELVEHSSAKKARAEQFITRFARFYTPVVVLAAVALAVLPPLALGWPWRESLRRALTFLVVSCPCALVISVPLAFFGGIGGASREGILVKGGNYLEVLAKTQVVVFDKTGTLTQGVFRVSSIHPVGRTEQELLELAALAECWSDHPISRSLKEACGQEIDTSRVSSGQELPGRGVKALVDGRAVCVGNGALMAELGLTHPDDTPVGTVIHVAADSVYAGYIVISDQLKPDAAEAVAALKAAGVGKTVMLTGDTLSVARAVAQALGLDEVHAGLLPDQKVARVEALLAQVPRGSKLAFVGDGINDAPVLSRADVGIAMGALGSDAAIEAADVVLMDDKPSRLPRAISIARRTIAIARQNIVFALAVKVLVLVLSALGITGMWLAVFADVGVAVLAILNAMRTLRRR